MIERPKRAVTRFFIPLIDVLILLFCIFLLMPFMSDPGGADGREPVKKDLPPQELYLELAGVRIDLDRARREVKKLRGEQKDPAERLSVCVLEIDPKDGSLFYYVEGKRRPIASQRDAQEVIDERKVIAGPERQPFIVMVLPHVNGLFPTIPQLRAYHNWFMDVPHRFDRPLGLPFLEDKQ